jgi:undecaprenyl-diphosphatase
VVGLVKEEAPASHFVTVIIIAFFPAMIIGALAHDFIKQVLFNPMVVSVSLIVGGIAILLIERKVKTITCTAIEKMSYTTALKIGFFQCIAMIPGVSRSGATIMGALLMGVERKTAAEFSFFLAIPTIFAATVYDLYKNWGTLSTEGLSLIAIGFITAFITAALVVNALVGFVSRHGFAPFAYYRIMLGGVMLVILLAG